MKSSALRFLGILILLYLLFQVGIGKVVQLILSANPLPLAVALVSVALFTLLQAFKWQLILKKEGFGLGFKQIYGYWLEGLLYGMLTPGKIGSFIRVKRISEATGKSLSRSLSNVLLDRLIDLFSVFFLAALGAILVSRQAPSLIVPSLAVLLLFTLIITLSTKKNLSRSLFKGLFEKLVPSDYKRSVRLSYHAFYKNIPSPKELSPIVLLSLINWSFNYSLGYLVADSIGIDLPLHLFVLLPPISTLVGLIPITFGGFGTREATLVALFSLYNVPADKVISMSILSITMLGYLPAILAGIYKTLTD